MEITVDLFYRIRDLAPEQFRRGPVEVWLPDGATVADLLALLELDPATPMVLLVDGRVRGRGEGLAGSRVVTIFPPLDGG